jgi:hypothetical protein
LSDALNVLFVRVNKLEYQLAHAETGSFPSASTAASATAPLSDSALATVLSRLDALEKAPAQAAVAPFLGGRGVATARDVTVLQEKLAALDKEYQETKTLLMQLQNYTLETNQKLVNLVLAPSSSTPSPSQPSFESVSEPESASASASPTFSHIPEEVQKDLAQNRSSANQPAAITLSLKEIVKKELSSSDA